MRHQVGLGMVGDELLPSVGLCTGAGPAEPQPAVGSLVDLYRVYIDQLITGCIIIMAR